MTPDELRAIRKTAAPGMSQADYARLMGYRDRHTYRRYETGTRDIPPLVEKLALMIAAHGTIKPLID